MFQIEKTTQVTCLNANTRTELHGTEKVRAIDLSFCLTGENTLLNLIQDGLREHHYFNKAMESGQAPLPDVLLPLPNLRFPRLPTSYHFAKGEKWRGYRWIWDFGTEEAHRDFSDVALSNVHYELLEGGSSKVFFTVQYNGEELADNEIYGELSGLASMGDVHIQLIAPAELIPVKKGYRAGKPDTPPPADGGQADDLLTQGDESGGTDTPEKALLRAHGGGDPAATA